MCLNTENIANNINRNSSNNNICTSLVIFGLLGLLLVCYYLNIRSRKKANNYQRQMHCIQKQLNKIKEEGANFQRKANYYTHHH